MQQQLQKLVQRVFTHYSPAVTTCYSNYYNYLTFHSHFPNHGWNITTISDIFHPTDKVISQHLTNKFSLFCFLTPPAQLNQSFMSF